MKQLLFFVLMLCSLWGFAQELEKEYVIVNVFTGYKVNVDLGDNSATGIPITPYKGDATKKFKKFHSVASILNHFDSLGYDFVRELQINDPAYDGLTIFTFLLKRKE